MTRALMAAAVWGVFFVGVLLGIAYPRVEPVVIAKGERCFRCGRVITDTRLAAEMWNNTLPTKYRTAECMARYVAAHPDEPMKVFVTDHTTRQLIKAERAWFVAVADPNKTETEYRAYSSAHNAERAARALNTVPVSWDTVVARARSL